MNGKHSLRNWSIGFFSAALLVVSACSDDDGDDTGTAGRGGSGGATAGSGGRAGASGSPGTSGSPGQAGTGGTPGSSGSGGTAGSSGEAGMGGIDGEGGEGGEAGAPPTSPAPKLHRFELSGPDTLNGVVADAAGNFYAVGSAAPSTDAAADRYLFVAKFLPSGQLDTNFGTQGVAKKNVAVGGKGGEQARGIALQSDGKIVILGVVEHDVAATGTAASDRDAALVRFTTAGVVDTQFGTQGVRILDLNTGIETTGASGATWTGADAPWSIDVYGAGDYLDKIVVHASQRGEGLDAQTNLPRTDTDWALVRLTPNGENDNTFSGDGKYTLDIKTTDGKHANGTARAASILPDGTVIGSGYSNAIGVVAPVLYKLSGTGEPVNSFGVNGVYYDVVLGAVAEAYDAAFQNGKLVTSGYGRDTTQESLDFISLRFSSNGKLDRTYGESGVARIDVDGRNDNSRGLTILPDQRVMLLGSGIPQEGNANAMIAILTPNGDIDTDFDPYGYELYDLGGPSDFFWAAAVAPNGSQVAVVGLKGAGTTQTAENNDDSAVFFMPLTP